MLSVHGGEGERGAEIGGVERLWSVSFDLLGHHFRKEERQRIKGLSKVEKKTIKFNLTDQSTQVNY